MCEFCREIRDYVDSYEVDDYIYKSKDGKYNLVCISPDGCLDCGKLYDIHYCPVCGRKLSKGSEFR